MYGDAISFKPVSKNSRFNPLTLQTATCSCIARREQKCVLQWPPHSPLEEVPPCRQDRHGAGGSRPSGDADSACWEAPPFPADGDESGDELIGEAREVVIVDTIVDSVPPAAGVSHDLADFLLKKTQAVAVGESVVRRAWRYFSRNSRTSSIWCVTR